MRLGMFPGQKKWFVRKAKAVVESPWHQTNEEPKKSEVSVANTMPQNTVSPYASKILSSSFQWPSMASPSPFPHSIYPHPMSGS